MGHVASKQALLNLQRRLDKMPIGAPAHRALFDILEQLYTEEECRLAAVMPFQLASARRIARIAGMDRQRVVTILKQMVEKGLVLDLRTEDRQTRYFLNPAVIGFFEFTMMKKRPAVDQQKLSQLMWEYVREDPKLAFLRMAAEGPTFFARPLVHEDVLEPEVYSEVLDDEKASELISGAFAWAEGICHCRHVKLHLGKRCRYPLRHCLALNAGAETLVRADIARPIAKERALEILAYAREHGVVQMADNVKKRPTFVCNCCKCCCEMMEGFRTLPRQAKVVSSNYEARSDAARCTGCGRCARACPIEVIDLVPAAPSPEAPKRKRRSQVRTQLCLGCGVCTRKCRFGAIHMRLVGERVFTPENSIIRLLHQALERGKLGNLIFDDHTRLTHRTLSAVLNGLISLPPAKQLLARQQVKSRFVDLLLDALKTARGRKAIPRV